MGEGEQVEIPIEIHKTSALFERVVEGNKRQATHKTVSIYGRPSAIKELITMSRQINKSDLIAPEIPRIKAIFQRDLVYIVRTGEPLQYIAPLKPIFNSFIRNKVSFETSQEPIAKKVIFVKKASLDFAIPVLKDRPEFVKKTI